MLMRAVAISLAIACSLAACASPTPEPRSEPAASPIEPSPAQPVVRFVAPTPAMLEAGLAGDPARMRESTASLLGCQEPSSCPSEFGSCTNWSGGSECDSSCDWSPVCRCAFAPEDSLGGGGEIDPNLRDCEPGDTEFRLRATLESYRICFTPEADACTEWRQTYAFMGCNC